MVPVRIILTKLGQVVAVSIRYHLILFIPRPKAFHRNSQVAPCSQPSLQARVQHQLSDSGDAVKARSRWHPGDGDRCQVGSETDSQMLVT